MDVDNVDNSVGNSFLAKICHFCMLITLWVFCWQYVCNFPIKNQPAFCYTTSTNRQKAVDF